MVLIRLILVILLLPVAAFGQWSVGAGIANHNDAFRLRGDTYAQFSMLVAGADYRLGRWHPNIAVSFLQSWEHLDGDFSDYVFGSHSSGYVFGDKRSADAHFAYAGLRLGLDLACIQRKHFRLLAGLSGHFDFLVAESYANRYRTMWGDYPSGPEPVVFEGGFEVLDLAPVYSYTNFALKPSFSIGKLRVEFQVMAALFTTPRVINLMNSHYGSTDTFQARRVGQSGPYIVYVSNEIGLYLIYSPGKARN